VHRFRAAQPPPGLLQEYLAEEKKRCDELSNMPMDQLSLAQRQELVIRMF
jgi:hypothetical protein